MAEVEESIFLGAALKVRDSTRIVIILWFTDSEVTFYEDQKTFIKKMHDVKYMLKIGQLSRITLPQHQPNPFPPVDKTPTGALRLGQCFLIPPGRVLVCIGLSNDGCVEFFENNLRFYKPIRQTLDLMEQNKIVLFTPPLKK